MLGASDHNFSAVLLRALSTGLTHGTTGHIPTSATFGRRSARLAARAHSSITVPTQRSPDQDSVPAPVVPLPTASSPSQDSFAAPGLKKTDYTDGRLQGDWESKYPQAARSCINQEAYCLCVFLVLLSVLSGILLGLSGQSLQVPMTWLARLTGAAPGASVPVLNIDFRLLIISSVGSLGGTTFSIKWLVHAVAKCTWHLDRRYWRLFVPLIGGVYSCVVLTLFDGGMVGAQSAGQPRPIAITAAFAFLVGYFSDGVSGLLSNVANAGFGTLENK